MITRRDLIALSVGAMAWSSAVRSEQSRPVIGWLSVRSAKHDGDWLDAFRDGLRQGGFSEDRNVLIEYRYADDQNDRLPELAKDLAARRVALIVSAGGTPAALAAKAATPTIPILFLISADPVRAGLVSSLNRPGENVTGIAGFTDTIVIKRLELLARLAPDGTALGALLNSANPNFRDRSSDLLAAASRLGREVRIFELNDINELEIAIASAARQRLAGLVVQNDTLFTSHSDKLAEIAARVRMPTIFEERESVRAGGLMSYGPRRSERLHALGLYASRILKGENPGTLPVEQPATFELIINLKIAKAMGIVVPPTLLGQADEVIE